jgi:NAD-dependent protein deacetylase/lipoamidase
MASLYGEVTPVEQLAALVRTHQPCVVLTGAGISTESGIPDFRSADGVWRKYDPIEYATIDAFLADPGKVWDFYARRLEALADAKPNDGHHALAELERRGWVEAVITQNVDGLHSEAGSRTVIEVHGSIRTAVCLACDATVSYDDALARLPVPACPDCGRPLKPNVVMFGELLPPAAIDRSVRLAAEAGLLLVVGSSLEVYPVAGLPLETLAAGGKLALVNRGQTELDGSADFRLDAGAGETLAALARALPERNE